ncbi:MAG: hypothetical protein ACK4VW_04510 [Anaerolineales bacterium]
MTSFLLWFSLILLVVSCGGLLLARRRKWRVLWLILLYLPFAWLIAQSWPPVMALLRLFAGWIVAVLVGSVLFSISGGEEKDLPFGPDTPFFYLQALVLVIGLGIGATRLFSLFLNTPIPVTVGSIALSGSGILLFSLNPAFFPHLLGILLFINGFELLYSSLEASAFLLFLFTMLNLLAGLAIAYLLVTSQREGEEL